MPHEWSQYQRDIFRFVEKEDANGGVIAVAGSSKTTVAVESMNLVPSMLRVRFNCFSNLIKNTLVGKVSHLRNAEVSTYNALGWSICRKRFGWIKLATDKDDSGDKTRNILKYQVFKMGSESDRKDYYKWNYNIKRLVSMCKGMAYMTVDQAMLGIDELVDHHAIDIIPSDYERFKAVFAETYKLCISTTKVMDFDDQLFMVIKHNLPIPKVDILMVDEFQDTNLIQYEFVKRSAGRVIAIGDPDQSIYGFRGSAPEIIDTFMRDFKATRLPLYICYRCSKAAVRNARQWVSHIEPFDRNIEGVVDSVSWSSYKKMVKDNDLVLCRNTAPLIKSTLEHLVEGRPAYVRGKDIKEGLERLIDIVSDHDDAMDIVTFDDKLREHRMEKSVEYERLEREVSLQILEDQTDALFALIPGCGSVDGLKRKIGNVIKENGVGICHMTIHKAKGLETTGDGDVYSLSYKPRKLKRDWMINEEKRLKYVEATRTKRNHLYVMEDK